MIFTDLYKPYCLWRRVHLEMSHLLRQYIVSIHCNRNKIFYTPIKTTCSNMGFCDSCCSKFYLLVKCPHAFLMAIQSSVFSLLFSKASFKAVSSEARSLSNTCRCFHFLTILKEHHWNPFSFGVSEKAAGYFKKAVTHFLRMRINIPLIL